MLLLQTAAREAQAAGRPYVKAKKLRAAAAAAAATALGKRKTQVISAEIESAHCRYLSASQLCETAFKIR